MAVPYHMPWAALDVMPRFHKASEAGMGDDALVIFTPSGRRGRVAKGTRVLDAARALGADLDSVCGGRGICSKCQVAPSFGAHPKHGIVAATDALSDVNAVERRYDEKRGLKPGRRLGCQALIEGDVVLDVPPESQVHRQVVRKAASSRPMRMDPAVRLHLVDVAEPDMHRPSGDAERLVAALAEQWGIGDAEIAAPLMPRLQRILRRGAWRATAAVHRDHRGGRPRVLELWPGYFAGPVHGLAIDLGSTTIAAHLTRLDDGEVVASAGVMNPQIRFGEDLMSRVSHAMLNEAGTAEMCAAVRAALADLASSLATEAEVDPATILDAVIVGNPVMHHLLMGLDPSELGQAPFALAVSDAVRADAASLGLTTIAPAARAYILPLVAGHVGADAAAVALSEAPQDRDELTLVVDVGTNAEILLGDRRGVLACSSPTGPAFEGAQISAGQRAAPGAIEAVRIDPATKRPRFRVIGCDLWSDQDGFAEAVGAGEVTGICGSGIIEAIAEMRLAGLLDASGLIGGAEATGSDRIAAEGRTNAYLLHEGADGRRIAVTQNDVRAIQLAKSALHAGARLLMDEIGADRVDRIVLAGAFGAHISPIHALILGLIPDCDPDRVTSAGNAAGTGARMALCDTGARTEVERQVRAITKVETAVAPRFQEHFVAANAIPHATEPYAALARHAALPDIRFGAPERAGRGRRRRAS